MKKLLIILFLLFSINTAFAEDKVSFIYINGSNNNDEKMKNWYENGVRKLHPMLRKKFLQNKTIKQHYSKTGELDIKEEPVIYFWGNKSKEDLDFVRGQLDISKAISSTGAYIVRNLIAQFLHDAIWVQKDHNMIPLLDELNEEIKKETNQGRDVILFGYSAGTFIAYEYLFNKLRYINVENFFKSLNSDDEFLKFVAKNPRKNTCLSALGYNYSQICTMSASGHIILNKDKEQLKNSYLKLDEITECACAPDKKFRGIVNFASPLVLFYSDIADTSYEINYFNKYMTKYIFENGIFWITTNFKEDPLGFPTSRNLTIKEMEDRIGMDIVNPSGVIYDNSSIWSKRMFPFAHTAYWSARRTFANAIVKSFINGYKFQYDEEYQEKIIKKNNPKSEL
ncbi:hypothetical protein IJD44_05040 [bacterium]|nr:hypothetical protein [bacterium]